MKFRKLLLIAIATFFTVSAFAPNAFAKKSTKRKSSELAKVLGDVKWGDSKDTVLKKMKTQLMAEARKDPRVKKDPLLMQKARKTAIDRHKKAEKSFTRLAGDTGYEVSVIGDEFSSDNGESFIRVKDQVAQRFYFFVDGALYKLVVAYNAAYLRGIDFESFVANAARKYGRPTSAEYDDIRGEEQLALVSWEDPETSLHVKNKKELFDTYTMAFTDRQTLKRMTAKKGRMGGSDKDEEELSAQVQDLMASSEHDAHSAVVDDITGARTKIDFKEGRPQDDADKRYDEDGNLVDVSEKGDKPKAPAKKKKKKKKKKRTKKNAPDFSKIDSKGSDDLIIY